MRHSSKEWRWTLIRGWVGDRTSLGSVGLAAGVLIDTSDRRNTLEQRMRLQRLEGIANLAGGIAHDLNNVLSPTLMAVELFSAGPVEESNCELLRIVQ